MSGSQPTLVLITTVPVTLWSLLRRHIRFLASSGFVLHAVSSPGKELQALRSELNVETHELLLERRLSPLADLRAVYRLWRLLHRLRPAVVHTHTPKAGLLGMIAAFLARVHVRIYTINGLPLMTRRGWQRLLLLMTERAACALATEVLCVSHSLRQEVIAMGLCHASRIRTLGAGSSGGVDLERFNPDVVGPVDRSRMRKLHAIPEDALVLAYVGRLVRDKGVDDLAVAWTRLREEFPTLRLFLCGRFESQDPVASATIELFRNDCRVHMAEILVDDMAAAYAAADLCVLPTYREGLPNVALECGAMKVALVTTRIPGCVDAVVDGKTGLLVAPRDVAALTDALRRLLRDRDLRYRLGEAARDFVSSQFSHSRVLDLLLEEYRRLLSAMIRSLLRMRPAKRPSIRQGLTLSILGPTVLVSRRPRRIPPDIAMVFPRGMTPALR